MIIGHLVILNSAQEIKDIQGQEWKEIVHTILRIGIIRALNESAGRLFRAAFLLLTEMLEKPISVCDCGISRSYSLTFFV